MALTKADIVEAIQSKNNLTREQSKQAAESIIDIMKNTLSDGEDVLISGFGKFCVNEKNERKGRNGIFGTVQ